MLNDLRLALKAMRRRPLVAGAVILTLGIGIGANTAVFGAFNAAFLRPLPFADADRLMRVFLTSRANDAQLSPRTDVFLALRDHNRVFSSVAGQRYNDFTLGGMEPQQIAGIEVSEGWARTLGITPQLGRTFTADEERHGGSAGVALISDAMWRTRFGARRAVLGGPITLNARPFTIVGVLPRGVRFPYEADVWIPARFDQQLESTWALNIVGRLRDGITPEIAVRELAALGTRLEPVRAQTGMTLEPVLLRETLIDDEGAIVVAVTIASAFLLLLVAVNVANLLAVQSLSRRRELAIRSALGATFLRHLRRSMIEGLVLAAAGGVVGIGVAAASTSLLAVLVPENFTYVLDHVPFDTRVIAWFAGVVLLTGLVFGAIPLLRTRRDSQQFLIGTTRMTEDRPSKARAAFATTAQIALALVLLAGAHALIRDVQRRLDRDLGYDRDGLLLARVALPAERYGEAEDREQFFDMLMQNVDAIPGVEAAGTVNLFPAAGMGSWMARLEGEGVPYREESPLLAHNRVVHGRLLESMRLRLETGRFVTPDELQRGDAVAVISRGVAGSFWPGQDPIGKRVRNRRIEEAPWLRVVGVVADLDEAYADSQRSIWTPLKLNSASASAAAQGVIVVRSPIDPSSMAKSVREAVRRVDPQLAVFEVATAEQAYRDTLRGRESARTLTGAFGLLGLIVAAIGVYSSMAFATSRRTREIAVRLALGATPRVLMRQFLTNASVAIGIGIAAGIALSFAMTRAARTIAGDFTLDAASIAIAGAVLVGVALFASWMPLRRAMRLDPSAALQSD